MGGVVFSALAGGLAGAGSGMNEIGKNMMLEDNLKLKADLDQQREVRLQEMRNASAADVANIHGETARDVADTSSAASGYAAETAAGAHEYSADSSAQASKYHADTAAAASKYAADTGLAGHKISSGATIRAAEIHADAATHAINVDKDGFAYTMKGGKAIYITDEDGERIESNKDLTPATKVVADGLQRRIAKLEADFNDPQKGMLIRSNKDEAARYTSQIAELQNQLYTTLGLDPADFALRTRAAPANRPPLNSFVK